MVRNGCRPSQYGQTLPVSWLVLPLTSGSVVQSSWPTVCASTNMKSHVGSVSRCTQNDSSAPPAGTLMVRASRLYDGLAACE
jgi:hypothetical protein